MTTELLPAAGRSKRLAEKFALAYPVMLAASTALWSHPQARALYPHYLKHMHMVVRSSVNLMREAAELLHTRHPGDPISTPLATYLQHHLKEEKGHDEWLIADYVCTGHEVADLLSAVPPPCVANLVGAQYYWMKHHHPVAVLGHIAALEFHHPPQGFARHLSQVTGYPTPCFRTIERHERLDVAHKAELVTLIDALPMTPAQEALMGLSGLHTLQFGVDVLERVLGSVAPASALNGVTQAS
jgi:hypothetical protein